MARTKSKTNEQVLDDALELVLGRGLTTLTFSALAQRSGLSAATLVQRFSSKNLLLKWTLLHAWDRLDETTADLDARTPLTDAGAIELLVGLSQQYNDPVAYQHAIMLLREDISDPGLRQRGIEWEANLCAALDARLDPGGTSDVRLGPIMVAYWQGVIILSSFHDNVLLEQHLNEKLLDLLHLIRE